MPIIRLRFVPSNPCHDSAAKLRGLGVESTRLAVMAGITLQQLPRHDRLSRYQHMVLRFSRDAHSISELRNVGVGRPAAQTLIRQACAEFAVTEPLVTFHARRGPHTGYCMAPRQVMVSKIGEDPIASWESQKAKPWPETGMIRLGDPTSLETVTHELGHHLVNWLERPSTPPHGKVWVGRFDDAVAVMRTFVSDLAR